MTWCPFVVSIKNFMSSGRRQGRSLFLPMTRFFVRAAMAEIIMLLFSVDYPSSTLQCMAAEEIADGHSFFSFRLQFVYGDPSISGFKIKIIFAVCNIFTGFLCIAIVRNNGCLIDLEIFSSERSPCGGIRTKSPHNIADLFACLIPLYLTSFLEELRCVFDLQAFRLRCAFKSSRLNSQYRA